MWEVGKENGLGEKRRKFITKWNGYFQLGHLSFDNIQSAPKLKLKKHTKVLFCISFFAWFHYVAAKILCFRCQFVSVVVIRGNNEIQNLINLTNKVTKEIRQKNETTIKNLKKWILTKMLRLQFVIWDVNKEVKNESKFRVS